MHRQPASPPALQSAESTPTPARVPHGSRAPHPRFMLHRVPPDHHRRSTRRIRHEHQGRTAGRTSARRRLRGRDRRAPAARPLADPPPRWHRSCSPHRGQPRRNWRSAWDRHLGEFPQQFPDGDGDGGGDDDDDDDLTGTHHVALMPCTEQNCTCRASARRTQERDQAPRLYRLRDTPSIWMPLRLDPPMGSACSQRRTS